ncbi:cyclic peptide export ABC transporter [Bowmanella denitrificans]|uniref:cyclic peptide export ABC transporter n=1 Tax=Bowmanella denitrificans TaxID=366582 RepID=UPI000C9B235E|nr:cyclic peptide export ABC transporter [Bowmanella denitrificans]
MLTSLYFKYKWYLIFTVPMSLLLGMASMSVIAIISDALGNGLDNMQYGPVVFFCAIGLLFLLGLGNELLRARLSARVSYDIQQRMIARVSATSLEQVERVGLPKVIATMTQDLTVAVRYFHVLPELCVNIAIVLCGVAFMAYLSLPVLGLVAACLLLTGVVITLLVLGTHKDRVSIREQLDTVMGHYQSLVKGAKELTLNRHRQRYFTGRLTGILADIRGRTQRVLSLLAWMESWGQLAIFAILGTIIFLASHLVPVSGEIIVGFVITLLFLLEPIEVIISHLDELVQAKVAFDKIDKLKLAEAIPQRQTDLPLLTHSQGKTLSLHDVVYRYEREDDGQVKAFQLGPLSLQLQPGEVTLIIGGNGTGKSTLLKVICGLYPPQSGQLQIAGQPVCAQNMAAFRDHFSLIMPDFCLFEDVLDANGQPCEDAEVAAMLTQLKLDKVVSCKNAVLDKLELSQGQRKRLALLLMYFESRPIVLLDEWAADQDPTFKRIFYKEILPSLKAQGKTVVVVSHDERYFDSADKVYKLDEGRLQPMLTKSIINADQSLSQHTA